MVVEKYVTFGAEYTMQYAGAFWSFTLKTCMVLLTNVTPIKKKKRYSEEDDI